MTRGTRVVRHASNLGRTRLREGGVLPERVEKARDAALRFLRRHNVMALATAGLDGPWASAVFYAPRGFTLYFVSSPASRHGEDLAAHPQAAAAIHEGRVGWRAVRGLQLEGLVTRLRGDAAARAARLYARRFRFVSAEPALASALARSCYYRLRPARVLWIDNGRGFGRRVRIRLSGPRRSAPRPAQRRGR